MIGCSLGSNDGKVLGYDEVIKLGYTDGKLIGPILRNVNGITLGLDFGTDMGALDGSFEGSKSDKLKMLLLRDSLGYTGGKVLGSDEGIKLG